MTRPANKGKSSRVPPVPSASPDEIDEWMRKVVPDLHPVVRELNSLIRATVPGLRYAVKWKKAFYGLPDRGWLIEMVAYDVSVNVVFLAGADLDPPPPLGSRDRSRYIKVTTVEEAHTTAMRSWVEQAANTAGWSWG